MRTRLGTIGLLGCMLACLLAGTPAQAQSYPNRPITIVVPAAPGGVSDVMARLVAQRLQTAWGQQVIVENRGGANHAIGAAMVGKAAPDGHTMMVAAETVFVINPTLHSGKLPYDISDFAPVTGLVRINQGLLAHPSLPANNIAELIALARQKPGEITYGSSGLGAAGHVNVALLESMSGIKLSPIHYRGATPALNDVLAGHIMLTSVSLSASVPPYRAGKAKMLAVGSAKRLPDLPEVPATAETVPGYEAVTWFGLFTTNGTPREIIGRINAEMRGLFADQVFIDRTIAPNMFESMVSTPEQFAEFIKADSAKWSKVLREANIKVD
ncbi:MAG: tripartite tricarboxylate transporter substrate binding protein [Alphaproteobacteria bacterium]|nr:tripartite tricarboxylate transporter substrate binding protein [Alphaproteobacteria bacterium]